MLPQHPEPARRVAHDRQRLAAGFRVAAEFPGREHVADDAQHLAGRGDGGPPAAAAYGERLAVSPELAVAAAGGRLRALDRQGAQRLAVPADASRAAFPGALAVAGRGSGPRGAVALRREDGDVGAGFHDGRRCGATVDARYRGQQPDLRPVPGETLVDDGVVLGEPFPGPVEEPDPVARQEPAGFREPAFEGVPDLRGMPAHMARERGRGPAAFPSRGQPVEDAPSVDPEEVGEDAADAEAGAVDGLVDAAARPPGDGLPARPRDPAQLAERLRRRHARAAETEPADPCQPDAVGDAGLPPLDPPDVPGMRRKGRGAGSGDGAVDRLPVHAGAFRCRRRHAVPAEPARRRGKPVRKRAGLPCADLRIRALPGDARGRRDLHPVHVDARCAGVHDMERVFRCHGTSSFGWNARKRAGQWIS